MKQQIILTIILLSLLALAVPIWISNNLPPPPEPQVIPIPSPPPIPVEAPAPPPIEKKPPVKHYTQTASPQEVEAYMTSIFGDKAAIATAVLKHESGLRLNAKNWNCRYNGKSQICKKEDRHMAWSVDCGIGQTNIKGTECPKEWMTLEGNMKEVAKRYKSQGLEAWTSYTSGAYKRYL